MIQLTSGRVAFHLIDDGLANILGLETLIHATNFISRANIKIKGGLIECGNCIIGSTHNNLADTCVERAFYLFKDSACKPDDCHLIINKILNILICISFFKETLSIRHNYLSHKNLITSILNPKDALDKTSGIFSCLVRIFCIASSIILTSLTPALKFRASILDIEKKSSWDFLWSFTCNFYLTTPDFSLPISKNG